LGVKDLASAQQTFDIGNYKWATYPGLLWDSIMLFVPSSSNQGYREESHFALKVAFKELYI